MTTNAKRIENLTSSNRIDVDGISVSISIPRVSVFYSVFISRFI